MGVTVFYLPRSKINDPSLWDDVRSWQKTAPGGWDRLRFSPDFFDGGEIKRHEMDAMLDMLRLKQVDRVVYAEITSEQTSNLDWLAFIYSLKGYSIPVESLDGKALELDRKLEKLTQSFSQLSAKSKSSTTKGKEGSL